MKNSKELKNKTEIPEIPSIPQPILEAASNGKLVVFIGAGVSRLLGYPSWQNLAERYAEYLYKEGHISYIEYEHLKKLDPRKLLSICENFCEKKKISKPSISELLQSKEIEKDISNIYKLIYSWNVIYVTTNFDDELDKVAKKSRKEVTIENYSSSFDFPTLKNSDKKIISDPDQILEAHLYSSGNVIHLHGSLDSEKLILTISDYLYHYQHEKIQSFLNRLFTDFTVLFPKIRDCPTRNPASVL
ncbi:MAG: SIR2 family protein [Candidatus Desulfofervidaceae bacterium]|nr:SIR2 family protein [Candidatus Desulfofervidaceae bacterium]